MTMPSVTVALQEALEFFEDLLSCQYAHGGFFRKAMPGLKKGVDLPGRHFAQQFQIVGSIDGA